MDVRELLQEGREIAEQGHYDQASELIVRVLIIEPENKEAMFISAFILLKTDGLESAAEVYKRIIELNPNEAIAMLLLGLVYEEMNDLSLAKMWWARVINCKCDKDIHKIAINKLESYSDDKEHNNDVSE